jgi:hypothetical protein
MELMVDLLCIFLLKYLKLILIITMGQIQRICLLKKRCKYNKLLLIQCNFSNKYLLFE